MTKCQILSKYYSRHLRVASDRGISKPNGVPMQDPVGGWRALREMQWSPHDVSGMAAPAVATLGQVTYSTALSLSHF